jgi:pimeloyl-ACP methyl ester carboxylesterase
MATGYADVLDELGESDVLGFSLGGLVAQYIGAEHGEKVRRLVIDVAGYRLGEEGRRIVEGWRDEAVAGNWHDVYVDAIETTYSSKYRREGLRCGCAYARRDVRAFVRRVRRFV